MSELSIIEIIALSLVVILIMRQRSYSQTSRQTISGSQELHPFYKLMQPCYLPRYYTIHRPGFIAVITLECSGHLAYFKFDVSPYTQNEFYQAWDIYKNKSVPLYNREVYYWINPNTGEVCSQSLKSCMIVSLWECLSVMFLVPPLDCCRFL